MKHRVKMLDNAYGSEDGFNLKHYRKGRNYTISDYLCQQFIHMGVVSLDNGYEETPYGIDYTTKDIRPKKRGRPRKDDKISKGNY